MFIAIILLGTLLVGGCSNKEENNSTQMVSTTHNPTAKEILTFDSKADIFQWENIIYQTNFDWVDELELTKYELIGVIEYNTKDKNDFKDATANVLPVGTEIYTVKERKDILIAKYNGETKLYYALVEG